MPTNAKQSAQEVRLRDLDSKLRNAREAAGRDDAGAREQADLKLIQQEAAAEKLRAARGEPQNKAKAPAADDPDAKLDAKLDKALKDSFPGSDPVSFVEAAPLKPHDAALSTVDTDKAKGR